MKVPEFTPSGIERRFCRFSAGIFLTQILICALPAAGLLATGRASLAGYYFWTALGMTLLRLAFVGRRDEVLCLIIAVGPFMNLLRNYAFYNVVVALYVVGLIYYFVVSSGTVRDTLKKSTLLCVLAISLIGYYTISLINVRDYSSNLRMFELLFAATYVLIIGRNTALFGAALLGLVLSACLVGISMLPHVASGARLGMIEVGGMTLGNPAQLGLPLALGFLALTVDRGRWLNLQTKPTLRLLWLAPVLPFLALTSSRASWLVAAGGIFLCMVLGSRQRIKMLLVIALGIGAFQAVLHSPYGSSLGNGLKRTFGEDRSVRQRTSGRSDQWKVAWFAFNQSIESVIRGHGPGMGPDVYAKTSGLVDGVKYGVGKKASLHSLFMQIGVEMGLAGLLFLVVWLAVCLFKILKGSYRQGIIFPLVCFFGYLFIVVTVSGGDTNSGVFLGVALLGTLASDTNIQRSAAVLSPTNRSDSQWSKTTQPQFK